MEKLDILFAGDFCLRANAQQAVTEGKSCLILEDILPELKDKDISVINLEGVISEKGKPIIKAGPNLKMPESCIDFIKCGGFDIANIANNHIGDFGEQGVTDTIETLKKHNIAYTGAGNNLEQSRKPLFMQQKGYKVAFLSFAENEFGIACENTAGVCPLNVTENIKDIKYATSVSDITVVIVHGGNEYNPVPNPQIVNVYRSFIDAGAAAVIGMHTHCPQGFERYNNGVIVYSTGNFLFDMDKKDYNNFFATWWEGYMVKLCFCEQKIDIKIIPYHFRPNAEKIIILKGEEREIFSNYLNYLGGIITDKNELINYWYGWCMINGPHWLNNLKDIKWQQAYDNDESFHNLCVAMHLFTCESHYELIKSFLKMVYFNKTETAKNYINKIKLLQKGYKYYNSIDNSL